MTIWSNQTDPTAARDDPPADFVIAVEDPASGLRAFIVLDSLSLGPAAGGTRTKRYVNDAAALADARALARAMTVKCALAGLSAGGAKAVVFDHDGLDREVAFQVLGQRVEALGGLFRTAGDFGTTASDLAHMARTTQYVHCGAESLAAAVARSVVGTAQVAWATQGKTSLKGTTVAIQGCGAMGRAVALQFSRVGAKLSVADLNGHLAEAVAHEVGGLVISADDVLLADVDILAPCALGGVITTHVARELRAKVVCGAANNMLASAEAEAMLMERGKVWVPDVLSSAGAVVDGIGRTVMGMSDPGPMIDELAVTAAEIIETSRRTGALSSRVAHQLARARIQRRGSESG